MTQQPYYPPQQPYQAQQPYPQQFAQAPVQQPQVFAPQYAPQAPAQAPTVPLAEGSLDAFYSQPSAASGPSVSWTDAAGNPKPIGTQYVGIVARDVTNADVQQQTDFNTKQPLFYRDGRPKFAMKVPLKVQPSNEFPEGEASWYVKGQARDELVRAMGEVGESGSPKAGAVVVITLVQRRPSGRGLNPANVVQVQYQPANSGAPAQTAQAPSPQPVQPVAPPQYPASVDQTIAAQGPPPQWAQPAPVQAPQVAQPVQVAQAPQQQVPGAPSPAPGAAPQAAPQPPAGLSPEQAALIAQVTGQPQGQPAA